MVNNMIYGTSKNKQINCIGMLGDNNNIVSLPMKVYGNSLRIDNKKLVDNTVVFYDNKKMKYYYINILEYIRKGKKSFYKVKYKCNNVIETECGSFIKNCLIGEIIKSNLNVFFEKDSFWCMTVEIENENYREILQKEYVEVFFDGGEKLIKEIKKSLWKLKRTNKKFYIETNNYNGINNIKRRLHEVVFGEREKENFITHINGNTFDNRKQNLKQVALKDISKKKNGAGFPRKHGRGWYGHITVKGNTICSPIKESYEEADMDCLIIQRYFSIKHREDEWYKIENIDREYTGKLIDLMKKKLQKTKEKQSYFTKNAYEIIENENNNTVKIYDNLNNNCLISTCDLGIIEKGRISKQKDGYWGITIEKEIYKLHRFILGIPNNNDRNIQVDHLDKTKNNNTRDNIILTTSKGNLSNKKGKGYTQTYNLFAVTYNCYWEYISKHYDISKIKRKTYSNLNEAKEEVFKRKWLVNCIRPKFKNYEEYLKFEDEYNKNVTNNLSIDDYWIQTRFPNINNIIIPNYSKNV